jgi:hypothetical protein
VLTLAFCVQAKPKIETANNISDKEFFIFLPFLVYTKQSLSLPAGKTIIFSAYRAFARIQAT